jgi:hypothetical protein
MNTKTINYDQQATDFLTATATKFACFYYDHAPYFPDDKESRDIYTIRLRNASHSYTFKFGQSIANKGKAPRPYDVLACLTKSEPGTFQEFCSEYGYDKSAPKALRIYKSVVKEWNNLTALFTAEQLETLQEIN